MSFHRRMIDSISQQFFPGTALLSGGIPYSSDVRKADSLLCGDFPDLFRPT